MCDKAYELMQNTLDFAYFDIVFVDISESDHLITQYGSRIPVLKSDASNHELGWPFDARQLINFIELNCWQAE